jgi:hypothetical protein
VALRSYRCPVKVKLLLPCSHETEIPCADEEDIQGGRRPKPDCHEKSPTPSPGWKDYRATGCRKKSSDDRGFDVEFWICFIWKNVSFSSFIGFLFSGVDAAYDVWVSTHQNAVHRSMKAEVCVWRLQAHARGDVLQTCWVQARSQQGRRWCSFVPWGWGCELGTAGTTLWWDGGVLARLWPFNFTEVQSQVIWKQTAELFLNRVQKKSSARISSNDFLFINIAYPWFQQLLARNFNARDIKSWNADVETRPPANHGGDSRRQLWPRSAYEQSADKFVCPRKLTINLPRCGHQAKVPGAIRGQCPNWQYWMGCKWETEMVTKAPGGQWLNGLSRWPNMFPTCSQHVPSKQSCSAVQC